MTAAQPVPDGNLPAALKALGLALSALIEPKPHHDDHHGIVWVDSLYTQLLEELPGRQGDGQHNGVARSIPPICVDAADLLHEIDDAVAEWEPRPLIDLADDLLPPITVIRLQALEKRKWRPQDVNGIQQIAAAVNGWVSSIKNLLTPKRKWSLPTPCPACGTAVVYRQYAGERVRSAALEITTAGCVCQHCRHTWAPEYYQHLARTLGYALPEGVLE